MAISGLQISRINKIKIVQMGDSVISLKSNKQDSSKPKNSKDGKRKNTTETISLGKGVRTLTIDFFVLSSDDRKELINQLMNNEFCEIVDKFKGKVKAHIDSFEIKDSDKHIGVTYFSLSCTIQDLKEIPTINFEAKLKDINAKIKDDIKNKVGEIAKDVSTVETIIDKISGVEKFVDEVLDTIESGITKLVDIQSDALNAYKSVRDRIERSKRLIDTMKNIVRFPETFVDLLINLVEKESRYNVELFEVELGGKKLSEINQSNLSQIENDKIKKLSKAVELNNLVTASSEINHVFKKSFSSQQDFENHVKVLLLRLEHVGYETDSVIEKQYVIKSYSNQQLFRKIVEIEVTNNTPLLTLVFELYGNLDKYEDIEKLNNFKDNDNIRGKVKVYHENNNKFV